MNRLARGFRPALETFDTKVLLSAGQLGQLTGGLQTAAKNGSSKYYLWFNVTNKIGQSVHVDWDFESRSSGKQIKNAFWVANNDTQSVTEGPSKQDWPSMSDPELILRVKGSSGGSWEYRDEQYQLSDSSYPPPSYIPTNTLRPK